MAMPVVGVLVAMMGMTCMIKTLNSFLTRSNETWMVGFLDLACMYLADEMRGLLT